MQSGISAAEDLHAAFRSLTQDPSTRALLVDILSESLVPIDDFPSRSPTLSADLAALADTLPRNEARYILLRTRTPTTSIPPTEDLPSTASFAAITWIPEACPVRQKTLFASTRLTLVRALGADHFARAVRAGSADELSLAALGLDEDGAEVGPPEGGAGGGDAAMTEAERAGEDLREAEEEARAHAAEMGAGTGARKQVGGGRLSVNVGAGVLEAMRGLAEGGEGEAVLLRIDIPSETTVLESATSATTAGLASLISTTEPRYTFYKQAGSVLFIYSCPSGAKIKERMIYAATRRSIPTLAAEQGLVVAKTVEASDPDEVNAAIDEHFNPAPESATQKTGFAKPKRPGRR